MSKSDFNTIASVMDSILMEFWSLEGDLFRMCNQESYLDRKILEEEFYPEMQAARLASENAALSLHGWTQEEFLDAVTIKAIA